MKTRGHFLPGLQNFAVDFVKFSNISFPSCKTTTKNYQIDDNVSICIKQSALPSIQFVMESAYLNLFRIFVLK